MNSGLEDKINTGFEESLQGKYEKEITDKNKQWIQDTLSYEYPEFTAELMDCKLLSSGIGKTYIVTFQQGSFKNSALSFRKSTQLGEGFGEIGANITNGIKYDKYDKWFTQFISTDGEEILGGYRFCKLSDSIQHRKTKKEENKNKNEDKNNQTNSPMGAYYNFDTAWLEENKDKAIELGTAYTNPNKKSRYAMLNNLKALGAIINTYNNEFYLGKMTIPTAKNYNTDAADFMIRYLEKFFTPKEKKFSPKKGYKYTINNERINKYKELAEKHNLTGNRKKDQTIIENKGKNKGILETYYSESKVPNMFGIYLGMHEKLEYGGTIKNPDGTLESGIILPIDGISQDYIKKFIAPDKEEREKYTKEDGGAYTLEEYIEKTKKEEKEKWEKKLNTKK